MEQTAGILKVEPFAEGGSSLDAGLQLGENRRKAICHPSGTREQDARTVISHLTGSAAVKHRMAEACTEAVVAAAELIAESFRARGKLLLCGNGGSAADCQHLAAEFASRLSSDFPRPGLPALALTTDTSFLTAYANDFDFDGVFARQVQVLGKPGDVLLAITTSGRSRNVVQAAEVAKQMGLRVIALTGSPEPPNAECGIRNSESGNSECGIRSAENRSAAPIPIPHSEFRIPNSDVPLLQYADVAICIPSTNTQHIQEAHLAVEHILCHLVERQVFGDHGADDWGIESSQPNAPEFGPPTIPTRSASEAER